MISGPFQRSPCPSFSILRPRLKAALAVANVQPNRAGTVHPRGRSDQLTPPPAIQDELTVAHKPIPADFWSPDHAVLNQRNILSGGFNTVVGQPPTAVKLSPAFSRNSCSTSSGSGRVSSKSSYIKLLSQRLSSKAFPVLLKRRCVKRATV